MESSSATARLVELVSGRAEAEESGPLSSREIEVVELVAKGMTNRQIAEARGTSERTVANQVASACKKLGAKNRRQLAVALARGKP